MIGVFDFCGHYDWTFEWLRVRGGETLLHEYWQEAIARDSQQHAAGLIGRDGFAGMAAYWGHTLQHEGAGFHTTLRPDRFRIDMHACPSKGFLLRNGLEHYHDYCDHCLGWVGPMMRGAGFVVDHQHNHRGQCWWEFRSADAPTAADAKDALAFDVRALLNWQGEGARIDSFCGATDPTEKLKS